MAGAAGILDFDAKGEVATVRISLKSPLAPNRPHCSGIELPGGADQIEGKNSVIGDEAKSAASN